MSIFDELLYVTKNNLSTTILVLLRFHEGFPIPILEKNDITFVFDKDTLCERSPQSIQHRLSTKPRSNRALPQINKRVNDLTVES